MDRLFDTCARLAFCIAAAGGVASAGQVTARLVAQLPVGHYQIYGLVEGSAGTFYSQADGDLVFSVTTQGSIVYLLTLPGYPQYPSLTNPPVSAANGLFYSNLGYTGGSTSYNVFSVSSAPDSEIVYPVNTYDPTFVQNLPDGDLLGFNISQILKSDLDGNVIPTYQFSDGARPYTLLYATDGNYYGIAVVGGEVPTGYLYRLTPSGVLTKLYNFPDNSFGDPTYTGLLQASDGNLYGSTPGCCKESGTIFKITLSGEYTLLHTFGENPIASSDGLIEGSDGNLYGLLEGDGPGGYSALFRITKSGDYEGLYHGGVLQCPCSLIQGSDGQLYVTAQSGNAVVLAFDAGLAKPAPLALSFSPKSGSVGTRVRIWGANLLSASVQFNGVPTTTASNSGSNYVWATVPLGATTGPITVTTPGGTYRMRGSFTVR